MKKIVLFNHKGGVSKTTSTFHIGWKLAETYRVLLVDADPQCNLTSLFLGNDFDRYYDEEDTRHENIMDGVRNAFDGKPEEIKAIKCPSASRNANLFLLPGHMNLSAYDAQLNFAINAPKALSSLKSLPGSFNNLIEKTASEYGIDYVLIDLNPGLSTINQDLFLISDGFVVPTNPDTFSLMAIESLSNILPGWANWKRTNIGSFANSAYPFPEGTPKFIGEIPQRFNIRNGEATRPFRNKIDEISQVICSVLVPNLNKEGMLFESSQYENAGISTSNYILHEIKDFQGLAPKSHKNNVPVFALTDAELELSGAAFNVASENRDKFDEIYTDIANKIVLIFE